MSEMTLEQYKDRFSKGLRAYAEGLTTMNDAVMGRINDDPAGETALHYESMRERIVKQIANCDTAFVTYMMSYDLDLLICFFSDANVEYIEWDQMLEHEYKEDAE